LELVSCVGVSALVRCVIFYVCRLYLLYGAYDTGGGYWYVTHDP
jgi:hypothetical protein